MLQIGYNIEQIRLLKGLSREQFSDLFGKYGLTPDKLYSYEKGKAKPNRVLIDKLAEYIGVSVEDFTNKRLLEQDMYQHSTYSTRPKPAREPDLIRQYEELIRQLQETVKNQNQFIDRLLQERKP